MSELDDHQLLVEFARGNSESAFAALVERHVGLVYSTALRSTGNTHAAEEISQAVFIILARKAEHFSPKIVLSGWLYQTTRLTAANFLRGEIRRRQREQEAYMQSTLNEPGADAWPQIAPLLDDALGKLGERDRNAIVLRFFENKNLREVGAALGASEDAAKMRVNRALEKLRKIFTKRGVALTTAIIAGAVSANSVQAAPLGLAAAVTATAAKGAAVSGSTLTLIKGALKIMAWTKAKMAVAVTASVLLTAGTATVVVKKFAPSAGNTDKYFLKMGEFSDFQKVPPYFIVRPTHFKFTVNGTSAMGNKDRAIGRSQSFKEMLNYAYDFHNQTRTVMPDGKLPDGEFDFLVTVPRALDKFQGEIERRFGYAAHREIRNVDALALKVRNPNAPGLKPSHGNSSHEPDSKLFIDWSSAPIATVANRIEGYASIPVVDQTGLKGYYDVRLDWNRETTDAGNARLRQAVLDQLGLELVATNLPIEMLVVEKVK